MEKDTTFNTNEPMVYEDIIEHVIPDENQLETLNMVTPQKKKILVYKEKKK
jgi:hypothetical protein